ncbi:site-specific integrase [Natronosalvus caseinilyticus]|uniref:site-specific integrase n=1 Tax=Natronosalvus caseinilyticus TaxID=2953747 RepID=UPI0028AECE7D|nr:site-specific integrase [Natronosalvus caseinilyticus]
MRIDTDGDRVKCWLGRSEIDTLARRAPTREAELAIRIMGDCGLRSFEVIQICPKHKRRSEDGSAWLLRVPKGKDTRNGTGKARDTFLPAQTEQLLHSYQRDESLGMDEQYITVAPRSVRRWVEVAAKNAHETTGVDDWQHVSSHDLRRSWATYLLVEQRRNVRVVQSAGGWKDYDSMKPYLGEATEQAIVEELGAVKF